MPILREQDLLQIEQTLYSPKERELKARTIFRVNTNFNRFAREIGYDYYSRTGSAKVFAYGASAKDIPFVGEYGGRVTKKVFDIVTGVRYTRSEIEAAQAKSTLGVGPSIPLDMLRVETAKRVVAETENKLVFVGDSSLGISGILNHTGITAEDVAQGATGADAAAKRLWTNKTPQEILKDLRAARTKARAEGIFNPDTLVLPPAQFDLLDQPYSDMSTMTIRNWLNTQGVNFPKVIDAKELLKTYNGFTSVDCFLVIDSTPEVVEIAVTRELELLRPIYDILENSEQAIIESCAGIILRHPSAVYVGKGI